MFENGDVVFVRPLQYNHSLRKFSGCTGTVESVNPADLRRDKMTGIADLVTVLFDNWDGLGGSLRESFNETELGRNRRSMELIPAVEWEQVRRVTFFDRLKKRLGR